MFRVINYLNRSISLSHRGDWLKRPGSKFRHSSFSPYIGFFSDRHGNGEVNPKGEKIGKIFRDVDNLNLETGGWLFALDALVEKV